MSLRMEQADESVSQHGRISRYIEESGSTYVAIAFARRPKALLRAPGRPDFRISA